MAIQSLGNGDIRCLVVLVVTITRDMLPRK